MAAWSFVLDIDAGTVLGADIIALAHALGGVVTLPEDPQDVLEGDLFRAIDDAYNFVVPGQAAADFLIGGIGCRARRITHGGDVHARQAPEQALRSPETTHADSDHPRILRIGAGEWGAGHVMTLGCRNRIGATGQRLAGARQCLSFSTRRT